MKAKKKSKFQKHTIIDIIGLLLFVTCFVIDSLKIGLLNDQQIFGNIVFILLPAVITIVSIPLSISKEKIFGVERYKFNTLRSSWTYTFLQMVFITIFIFLLYAFCVFFGFKLSKICLDVISVFYAVYFSQQEIPLLIGNENAAISIINKYYLATHEKRVLEDRLNEEIIYFEKIARCSIFTRGLKTTFKMLKNKKLSDSIILEDLLSKENDYLFDAVRNISILKSNPSGEYKGININDMINQGYENIYDLLRLTDDFNYQKIFNGEDKNYQLTRSFFCLYKLTQGLELESNQINKTNSILFALMSNIERKDNTKNESLSFLNAMMSNTLALGEMWFAERLRDYDFPFSFISRWGFSIGFFYVIYCFYLSKICSNTSNETKTAIDIFVNSPSKSINSDGLSWIQNAASFIESGNDKEILSSISQLLSMYGASNDMIFYVIKSGVISSEKDSQFHKYHIFDVWLEIILYSPYFYSNQQEITDVLESLSPDDRNLLLQRMDEKWIIDGGLTINKATTIGFLKYLGFDFEKDTSGEKEETIKALCEFRKKYYEEQTIQKIKDNAINIDKFDEYKNKLGKDFLEIIARLPLSNNLIDLSHEKEFAFSLCLKGDGIDNLIQMYAKQMESSLKSFVREKVLDQVTSKFESKRYSLDDEIIKQIIAFKPDLMTSSSSIQYHVSEEYKDFFKEKVKQIENTFLPPNMFWKKGAIETKFEYIPEKSVFRKLKKEEIDQIIDNDFKMVKGLYKYGEYSNTDSHSFLITREQLFEYLLGSLYFSEIVFKCKVIVHADDVLFVGIKKTNNS